MAKQSRKSFSFISIKITAIFQLTHVDIWGPFRVPNHNGCIKFVIIMDDFSRFTWVHLTKYKSDVVDVLIEFVKYVEVQFKSTVTCIRSDNAKKLCEGTLKTFFGSQGNIHKTTCQME